MARRILRSLFAVTVAGAAVLVGAPPAGAVGAITVTPNTGLVDLQLVTVEGTGWVPGSSVGFCQAVPDATPDQSDCATFPGIATADESGNFSGVVNVRRLVVVHGQQVDCAAPSSPCSMAAAQLNDIAGTVVTQPLQFAAETPLILPGEVSAPEGDAGTTTFDLPVRLSFASTLTVSADWATQELLGCFGTQPADPATDFTAASGTVTFTPGDTEELIPISVNGDVVVEPDECVTVLFSNAVNAEIANNARGGTGALAFIQTDDTLVPDLIVKRRSDGVLLYDNQYNFTTHFHTIAPGSTWTYAVLVQNDGTQPGDIFVQAGPVQTDAAIDVQYFYGFYDVTAAVEGDGLLLPAMQPGELRPLAVRFRSDPGTAAGATADVHMSALPGAPVLTGDAFGLRVIGA